MAYKVQYSPQEQYRYPSARQKTRPGGWGIWVLIVGLAIAVCVTYRGIPDFLIPGDPEVTKSAAREMISLMKTGTGAYDAIAVFCKQIINGAAL